MSEPEKLRAQVRSMALLCAVFGPTLAALAYIHLGLEALRHLRQGAVVTIVGIPTIGKELK